MVFQQHNFHMDKSYSTDESMLIIFFFIFVVASVVKSTKVKTIDCPLYDQPSALQLLLLVLKLLYTMRTEPTACLLMPWFFACWITPHATSIEIIKMFCSFLKLIQLDKVNNWHSKDVIKACNLHSVTLLAIYILGAQVKEGGNS